MQPSAAQEPDAQKPDTDTPPKITLKSRAELRAILVNAGLGRTVAEKISQAGWAAISTTEADDDLAEACADLAQSLIANLRF